jgi:hypothetical protein
MSDQDKDLEVARSMADAVESLPMDDPLRAALGLPTTAGDPLRDELGRVPVPNLDDALLRVLETPSRFEPRRMSWVVAAAAAIVLAACAWWIGRSTAPLAHPEEHAAAERPAPREPAEGVGPRLIAVKIWHETCPACKIIDPRYETVTAAFNTKDVLFVTLDMSTEASRHQAALMAETLGIGAAYREHFGSSGFVWLVDPKTHEIVGELTTEHDIDRMRQLIADAAFVRP